MTTYAAEYTTDFTKEIGWHYINTLTGKRLRKILITVGAKKAVGFASLSDAEDYLEQKLLEYSNVENGKAKQSGGGMWEASFTFRYGNWIVPAVYKNVETEPT